MTDESYPSVEYKGKKYCYYEDEIWKWDEDLELWESLEPWPPEFEVIDGKFALHGVIIETEFDCWCSRKVLWVSGCQCGGN